LGFVHHLNYKKNHVLEAGFCFHLQVKKGKGQKPYLLGPLVELASDLESYNIEVPRVKNCG
jgi:hypothetical protein